MILEASSIHTHYGSSHILFGISIGVDDCETVCLLGRNGAGKTTTLKSIIGLVRPSAGSIKFEGVDLAGKSVDGIARMGIGFVPEDRRIFGDMTVLENLEVAYSGNRKRWILDDAYDLFPVLRHRAKWPGVSLSGGEQQMLAIARTLMTNPKLLLLDEPAEGLSPIVLQDLTEAMYKLQEKGIAVLLAEQRTEFALKLSRRAYILEKGMIRYEGSIEELRENAEVRRKYLAV